MSKNLESEDGKLLPIFYSLLLKKIISQTLEGKMMKQRRVKQPIPIATGRHLPALSNNLVIEKVLATEISTAPNPVRNIVKRGIATASAVLSKFGQILPILISQDGTIIVGEEFYLAAKELHWTHLNVVRITEISDADRRVLTIALARIPQLSSWNDDALRLELAELNVLDLDFDISDMTGFSVGEIDVILDPTEKKDAPDILDSLPAPLSDQKVVTRHGDIWIMGPHRIVCGNALEAATYPKLMNKRFSRTVLTDPPFNIRIEGNVSGLGKTKHKDFAMGVGEMAYDEFSSFLEIVLTLSCAHVLDGGLIFTFMDRRKLGELLKAAAAAELLIIDLCIWNKMSGGMGGLYRSQHEPCFVFKHGNAPHLNNVQLGKHGRYRTNVWDHRGLSSFGKGRDDALRDHPTVKPVALCAEAIKDCTKRGDIVLDPFAGSGSTIIAAEKTGRVGYGIELEPKYVDVCVRRWEAMTGESARLQGSSQTFAEVRELRQHHVPEDDFAGVKIRKRPVPVAVSAEVHHG
jgi:DNA modification methylase